MKKKLSPIVEHLLFGDIDEMPLSVLGHECPSHKEYQEMDEEVHWKYQAAATVQAWMEGRLHKKGYLFDPKQHAETELVKPLAPMTRTEFERATWCDANKRKHNKCRPALYDAGKLGFCVLEFGKGGWKNTWFDRAEQLSPQTKH